MVRLIRNEDVSILLRFWVFCIVVILVLVWLFWLVKCIVVVRIVIEVMLVVSELISM